MSKNVRNLTFTALFAAILCVMSPFAVNIGPIPLSLATVAVYLAGVTLGWKKGTVAVIVFILIGAVGVPVFSNFSGGLQKVVGPTGGYIIGYIPCALVAGIFADKWSKAWSYIVGMVLGTAVLYALGTAWYCTQASVALGKAIAACVTPFLLGDAIKIVIVTLLSLKLRPLVSGYLNRD